MQSDADLPHRGAKLRNRAEKIVLPMHSSTSITILGSSHVDNETGRVLGVEEYKDSMRLIRLHTSIECSLRTTRDDGDNGVQSWTTDFEFQDSTARGSDQYWFLCH